jgi:hypothetical protein
LDIEPVRSSADIAALHLVDMAALDIVADHSLDLGVEAQARVEREAQQDAIQRQLAVLREAHNKALAEGSDAPTAPEAAAAAVAAGPTADTPVAGDFASTWMPESTKLNKGETSKAKVSRTRRGDDGTKAKTKPTKKGKPRSSARASDGKEGSKGKGNSKGNSKGKGKGSARSKQLKTSVHM